jgi:7-cyano-7-deazaguanine synthase
MCGIAGALVYDPAIARLDCLLAAIDASAARGRDAFGVVRWSPSTEFRKYGCHVCGPHDWLEQLGQPESGELTAYLHVSRAEPTTEWRREKTESDIPPFVAGGIAVAHNGIIANDHELAQEHTLQPSSSIDTAIVPLLAARLGTWEAVAAIEGGCALAIFDSRQQTLALWRNFMPIVLTWEPGIVCFASEVDFFPKARRPFRSHQLWKLPPFSGIELSSEGFRGPWGHGDDAEKCEWEPYPELRWRNHG